MDNHVDSRIAKLEAIVEGLANSVTRLTNDVSSLAESLRNRERTNWGVIVSTATLVLALVVALGNGFVLNPLDKLENNFAVESNIARDFRRNLYQEFNTLKQEKASTHSLFYEHAKNTDKEIVELKRKIEDIEKSVSDNILDDSKSISNNTQRLDNLERLIFPDVKYRGGRPDG